MRRFVSAYIIVFLAAVSLSHGSQHGDVTGDGTVDGRDALRIIQVIEGRVAQPPPGDAFWSQADVHPLPTSPGGAPGDGAVTREDALTILRLAMGLISSGEFDGRYGQPVIFGYDPPHGAPGTRFTVSGENFVAGAPNENLVWVGEVEAVVESSTATELVVIVPAGAVTAPLRLITSGGWTATDSDFIVTAPFAAEFRPPAEETRSFTFATRFGEASVARDGQVVFEVDPSNWTLLTALPHDGSQAVYMRLQLAGGQTRSVRAEAETLDGLSTARALVFLSPFLLNWDANEADVLWDLITTDAKVTAFGTVAEAVLPLGGDPFDNASFASAFREAIASVASRLPAGDKPGDAPRVEGGARAGVSSIYSRDVRTLYIDRLFQESGDGGAGTTVLEVDTVQTNPVDWVVVVAELDHKELFNLFPKGTVSLRDADPLAGYWREHNGFEATEVRLGKAITRRFSILSTLVSDLVDGAGLTGSGVEPTIKLPDREGVYIVRCFAPIIDSGVDNGELAFIENSTGNTPGYTDHRDAFNFNITMLIIDSFDAAVGLYNIASPSWRREIVRATTGAVTRSCTREFPSGLHENMERSERFTRFLNIFADGADAAVKQGVTEAVSAGKGYLEGLMKQAGGALASAAKTASGLLTVLDAISYLGPIGERLGGMAGVGLVEQFGLELSPMETAFVTVGEPFDWTFERFEPSTAGPGETVTIIGSKFDYRNKDNNEIFFNEIPQLGGIRAETVSVSEDGTRLAFIVPESAGYGYLAVYLRTPFAQDYVSSLNVVRKPLLRALTPPLGFAAREGMGRDAFPTFRGTPVTLTVDNLHSSDTLFFGDVETARTGSQTRVPFVPGPRAEVYLRTVDDRESNRLEFQILGSPWLDRVSPERAHLGELVSVHGDRFGTRTEEILVTLAGQPVGLERLENRLFVFKMPDVGEPGVALALQVETPAGVAEPLQLIREPGVVVPSRPNLPTGYTLTVTDAAAGLDANGRLSLDEAAAFARGDENPYAPPWDDQNIEVVQHWVEKKRFNKDSGEWEYYFEREWTDDPVNLPGGPGYEYRRTYRVDHYHADKGGGTGARELLSTENLDATAQTREEGDHIDRATGGAEYGDDIEFQARGETYNCLALRPGPNDRVIGGVTVKTHISPIVLQHKSTLQVDAVEAGEMEGGADSVVLHITGDSNTVRTTFGAAPGTAVFIENGINNELRIDIAGAGGHGIRLLNAHLNALRTNFATAERGIGNCGGDGIRVEDGQENQISWGGKDIFACAGAGIRLVGGRKNSVHAEISACGSGCVASNSVACGFGGLIEDCTGNGLTLVGGSNHILNGLVVQGCQGHGIVLDGCSGNVFATGDPPRAENNGGSGLHLTGGSRYNSITGHYHANAAGIVMEGVGTAHNTLRNAMVWAGAENAGNRGPGLHIRGGASDNVVVALCRFEYNQGDGILIEGAGTSRNMVGEPDTRWNQGAGLVIRGPGAEANVGDGVMAFGCQGPGVVIADGALGTELTRVDIRECAGGGLRIDGVTKTWGGEEERTALATVSGLEVRNPQTPPAGEPREVPVCGVALLGGTSDVRVTDVDCYDGECGVFVGGVETTRNRLEDVNVDTPSGVGVHIEDATDTTLADFQISGAGSHGLQIVAAHGTQVQGSLRIVNPGGDGVRLIDTWAASLDAQMQVQSAAQNGVLVQGCSDLFLRPTGIQNAGANGVELQGSTDVELHQVSVSRAQGDGVLVDAQCSGVSIEELDCQGNTGAGIHLAGATNVEIGNIHNIYRNEVGVDVASATNVRIEGSTQGVGDISGNSSAGIRVQGESTQSVQIHGTRIATNGTAGVQVEAGSGIAVGLPGEPFSNLIADNPVGILATGSDTQVEVCNNVVGVPPAGEAGMSGSGAPLPGNATGIQFAAGISGATVRDNLVRGNVQCGVVVQDGAKSTTATGNRIEDNGGDGVRIQSAASTGNMFGGNRITGNRGQGIALVDGANGGIAAPVIRQVSQHTVSGTADGLPTGTQVEVYADSGDEGRQLLGTARVREGEGRNGQTFSLSAKVPAGARLNALAIAPNGNTSEFGPAQLGGGGEVQTYVFSSTRTGQADVFLRTPQGVANLTGASSVDRQPRLSPNGLSVAFVSDRADGTQLWRVPTDGGQAYPFTLGEQPNHSPDWHPDGGRLAYVSEYDGGREGNPEIHLLTLDTPAPTGEIAYEDGTPSSSAGWGGSAGGGAGVHFSSAPGRLGAIRFYLTQSPGAFLWRVYDWDAANERPGELLAEGETEAAATGWHMVIAPPLDVAGEFVVCLFRIVDDQPWIGVNWDNTSGRSWRYTNDKWSIQWGGDYMIRAVVPPPSTRLTTDPAIDQDPAWSPDGARIAFASDRGGTMALWMMDADGSNPQPVPGLPGNQTQPRWSPDGARLVFISDAAGNPDVWSANADGTEAVNLTDSPHPERDPCWTADGFILFASERDAGWEVYQMLPDGTSLRRLTTSFGENTEPHAP